MPNYGTAHLKVAVKEKRSVVIEQFGKAPLQLHRPLYLDANSFPTVFLRTPSYGLLDGDIHELFVQVEEHAQLELRTQGATLVYPGVSEQNIHIKVASGGSLRFLPHPLILASKASLKQRIMIELADDSALVFKESWVCGRIAMGESWQFTEFDNLVEIVCQGSLVFRECFVIQPERDHLTHPTICGAYTGFETRIDFGLGAFAQAETAAEDLCWHWQRPGGVVSRRVFVA